MYSFKVVCTNYIHPVKYLQKVKDDFFLSCLIFETYWFIFSFDKDYRKERLFIQNEQTLFSRKYWQ